MSCKPCIPRFIFSNSCLTGSGLDWLSVWIKVESCSKVMFPVLGKDASFSSKNARYSIM